MEEYDDEEEEEDVEEEEEAPEEEAPEEEAPEEEPAEDEAGGPPDGPPENREAEEYMAAGAGPWDFQDPPSDGEGNTIQEQQKDQVQIVVVEPVKEESNISNAIKIEVKKSKSERIKEYMNTNDFNTQSYKTSPLHFRTAKPIGEKA